MSRPTFLQHRVFLKPDLLGRNRQMTKSALKKRDPAAWSRALVDDLERLALISRA